MFTKTKVIKSFNRDLFLLMGEMFFRRLVMGFLEVVRTIYLFLVGFDPFQIGLILTIGTIISALDSLILGNLSDRYGRKPFILLGSITSTFRLVLYALSHEFWVIVIAQGIGAVGEGVGAGQPIVSGYIADKVEIKDYPRVFSTLAISNALSVTIGSLMAFLPAYFQVSLNLEEINSYILLFWIGAVLNSIAIVFSLKIEDTTIKRIKDKNAPPTNISWREIGKFCIIRSTDGLGIGLVMQLLPLYFFLRFGASSEDLAIFYALARLLSIPSYFFAPILGNKLGNVKCLIISRMLTGVIIGTFAMASSFPISIALFVTYRLLFEFAMPMRQAFSAGIVEPHKTGTLVGIGNSTRAFLQSLAPTIAGYLFELGSLSLPLFSGAILLTLNAIQYHMFYKNEE